MRSLETAALLENLREYIKLAESGETILISDGNRVVAELRPHRRSEASVPAAASLADLVRSGVVIPPKVRSTTPPPKPQPLASFDEVMNDLDESREDR